MWIKKVKYFRRNLFLALFSLLGSSAHAQTIGFTDGFEIANWERTEILAARSGGFRRHDRYARD